MTKKQLLLFGGIVVLGLLSRLWSRQSTPDAASVNSNSPAQARLPAKNNIAKGTTSTLSPSGEIPINKGALLDSLSRQKNITKGAEGAWTKPENAIYWDQDPIQKTAVDFFNQLGNIKFAPTEKPHFVGMNDQGFEQYEYQTGDGARVIQWKRSNEVAIEEATLNNEDKITRSAPNSDNPVTTVSYESKESHTYQRATYRQNGSLESLRIDEKGQTTIYYYDDQGRVTDLFSGTTP
jgi:hypothetical protein